MSKASKLLAGLGIGAASGYVGQKEREASEARIAAIRSGQTPPKEARPIDTVIDKVKGAFTTEAPDVTTASEAPAADPAIVRAPEMAPAAEPVTPDPVAMAPSPETVAFNDDSTVPNTPAPFENSYA